MKPILVICGNSDSLQKQIANTLKSKMISIDIVELEIQQLLKLIVPMKSEMTYDSLDDVSKQRLLNVVKDVDFNPLYDAVKLSEGQRLPRLFMVYNIQTKFEVEFLKALGSLFLFVKESEVITTFQQSLLDNYDYYIDNSSDNDQDRSLVLNDTVISLVKWVEQYYT